MELKSIADDPIAYIENSFNRTFMELKLRYVSTYIISTQF